MNNEREIYPKSNCLALTIRKEHRLTVLNKVTKTTLRVSLKTLLYAAFLTIDSIFV